MYLGTECIILPMVLTCFTASLMFAAIALCKSSIVLGLSYLYGYKSFKNSPYAQIERVHNPDVKNGKSRLA